MECESDFPEENERAVNIIQSYWPVLLFPSVAKCIDSTPQCYWIQAEGTQPHFKVNGTNLVHEKTYKVIHIWKGSSVESSCYEATQGQYGSINLYSARNEIWKKQCTNYNVNDLNFKKSRSVKVYFQQCNYPDKFDLTYAF